MKVLIGFLWSEINMEELLDSMIALDTIRMVGVTNLLRGLCFILIVVLIIKFTKRGVDYLKDSDRYDIREMAPIAILAAICIGALSAILGMVDLTDVWNYVAVINPEMFLMKITLEI
jgi:hypothetical protein